MSVIEYKFFGLMMCIFKMLQEDTYRIKPNNMHQANKNEFILGRIRQALAKDQYSKDEEV